jgi:hypothetical protein
MPVTLSNSHKEHFAIILHHRDVTSLPGGLGLSPSLFFLPAQEFSWPSNVLGPLLCVG